ARRLSYPLDSTNAVGSFMAIGLPLGLALAVSARTIAGQALAAAGVPVMGLCLFLTASRGGLIATVLAVIAFLILAPRRIPRLASLLVVGAATALLVSAVDQRPALHDGLNNASAHGQGDTLLVLLGFVCVRVAL